MSIKVSSNFDCGNIEVIDAGNPRAIRLNIRKEQTGELQDYIWFYFALTGAKVSAARSSSRTRVGIAGRRKRGRIPHRRVSRPNRVVPHSHRVQR
jgi:hypothetical protein